LGTFIPRHAKPYANLEGDIRHAAETYAAEVLDGSFPGPDQSVRMEDEVLETVLGRNALDRAPDRDAVIPLDRDL
jgi:hypothetical protein